MSTHSPFAELMAQRRRHRLPWGLRHPYRWTTNRYRDARFTYRRTRQRALRGWAVSDTWNWHVHISRIMIEGLTKLREDLHGWPGEPMTFEEWKEIITKIIKGFEAAQTIDDAGYWLHSDPDPVDVDRELRAAFDEGMNLLHRWFFHLWD